MYRLAICEDDELMRGHIALLAAVILTELNEKHHITSFASSEELDAAITGGQCFDMLLLDIQMQGQSGLELAQKLRRLGSRVSMIFITNREDCLRDGYSVQPIHFLLKPVSKEMLTSALKTDLRLNHSEKRVALPRSGQQVVLNVHEICIVESLNHECAFTMADGTHQSFLISMAAVEKLLPQRLFVRCHRCYLVNMEYMLKLSHTAITLQSGYEVPIGRNHYGNISEAFMRYLEMV